MVAVDYILLWIVIVKNEISMSGKHCIVPKKHKQTIEYNAGCSKSSISLFEPVF